MGFPGGPDGKESVFSVGNPGSISGSGRSRGERHGYPLQFSCLENSMDRGAWKAMVQRIGHDWATELNCPTVTSWIVAHQTPLSMEFSRQENWSGLPFLSPGDLCDPEIEPRSPALQADFYRLNHDSLLSEAPIIGLWFGILFSFYRCLHINNECHSEHFGK